MQRQVEDRLWHACSSIAEQQDSQERVGIHCPSESQPFQVDMFNACNPSGQPSFPILSGNAACHRDGDVWRDGEIGGDGRESGVMEALLVVVDWAVKE